MSFSEYMDTDIKAVMRFRSSAVILAAVMCASAQAISPPIPKTLAERVKAATHIFVGVAEDTWVVDKDGKRATAEQDQANPFAHEGIGIKVRVVESLRPSGWGSNTNITVQIGGGFFGARQFRDMLVGKSLIYLTRTSGSIYGPSYGWNLTEPLDKKTEIEGLLKTQSK